MHVIGHGIMADRPTAAPLRLVVDDLQQIGPVIAANQGNARMG